METVGSPPDLKQKSVNSSALGFCPLVGSSRHPKPKLSQGENAAANEAEDASPSRLTELQVEHVVLRVRAIRSVRITCADGRTSDWRPQPTRAEARYHLLKREFPAAAALPGLIAAHAQRVAHGKRGPASAGPR